MQRLSIMSFTVLPLTRYQGRPHSLPQASDSFVQTSKKEACQCIPGVSVWIWVFFTENNELEVLSWWFQTTWMDLSCLSTTLCSETLEELFSLYHNLLCTLAYVEIISWLVIQCNYLGSCPVENWLISRSQELDEKVALKKIEGVFEHITIAKARIAPFYWGQRQEYSLPVTGDFSFWKNSNQDFGSTGMESQCCSKWWFLPSTVIHLGLLVEGLNYPKHFKA